MTADAAGVLIRGCFGAAVHFVYKNEFHCVLYLLQRGMTAAVTVVHCCVEHAGCFANSDGNCVARRVCSTLYVHHC